jgi:hypothetical protein
MPRAQALLSSFKSSSNRPVFALTYHPHNLAAVKIVMSNFHILLTDPSTRDIFPDPPLVAFRRDRNLQDLLVHSRLLRPRDTPLVYRALVALVSLVLIRYTRTVYLSHLALLPSRAVFLVPPATFFMPSSACVATRNILVKRV